MHSRTCKSKRGHPKTWYIACCCINIVNQCLRQRKQNLQSPPPMLKAAHAAAVAHMQPPQTSQQQHSKVTRHQRLTGSAATAAPCFLQHQLLHTCILPKPASINIRHTSATNRQQQQRHALSSTSCCCAAPSQLPVTRDCRRLACSSNERTSCCNNHSQLPVAASASGCWHRCSHRLCPSPATATCLAGRSINSTAVAALSHLPVAASASSGWHRCRHRLRPSPATAICVAGSSINSTSCRGPLTASSGRQRQQWLA
jgi:hypothetical protein